jgi:hypothetical protein
MSGLRKLAALLVVIWPLVLHAAEPQSSADAAATFIPWLLEGKEQVKQVPFADVIRYATGKQVLAIKRDDPTDQRVLKQIGTALDGVIKRMSQPSSPVRATRVSMK